MPFPEAQQFESDVALAAATPVVTRFKLANCKQWYLHLHNKGAESVTAVRIRRIAFEGALEGPWISITADLPILTTARWELSEDSEACLYLDLELTSTVGTTVDLNLVGT